MAYGVSICDICERTLDDHTDPTSQNCGGTCVKCMALAGDPECVEAMRRLKAAKESVT